MASYQAVDNTDGDEHRVFGNQDIEMRHRNPVQVESEQRNNNEGEEIVHGFEFHLMHTIFQLIFGPVDDRIKRLTTLSKLLSVFGVLFLLWFYYETCWNCTFIDQILDDEFNEWISASGMDPQQHEFGTFNYKTFFEENNQYVCNAYVYLGHQRDDLFDENGYQLCALSSRGQEKFGDTVATRFPNVTGGYESCRDYYNSGEFKLFDIDLRKSCKMGQSAMMRDITNSTKPLNETCSTHQLPACWAWGVLVTNIVDVSLLTCTPFEAAMIRSVLISGIVGAFIYNLLFTNHWRAE